ncbi:MAG TPA: methyltransferase domain-containing protein [Verrucomicrobiae bacterium]|jgi:SAM-dependent methyltransferase|nr:methyltransferase domain-containing protein [Verrucomicrobiae bacterium]
MSEARHDKWAAGDAYEPYVGRWSRLVAAQLLEWLAMPPGARWLDVGCGTGALSRTILDRAAPEAVTGLDASEGFVQHATARVADRRASFRVGDAQALPFDDGAFDAAVSGLVLNFVPAPARMVAEMRRVVRRGGLVGLYVWDYADGMELMRHFWDAAAALDPAARPLDEGRRFPICRPEPLAALFRDAGLADVEVRALDVPTVFRDFDDYWTPFLGGQGPAPGYCLSLDEARRTALREAIRARLPAQPDGRIPLTARAWAARGRAA